MTMWSLSSWKRMSMTINPPANTFSYLGRFEHCLNTYFRSLNKQASGSHHLGRLVESMSYSTLDGGKRLRAMLVYLGAYCCLNASKTARPVLDAELKPEHDQWEGVDSAAVAIELMHCYSLVHDDLPAMDDDDLRRGKPTCHKAFDEATAILAGDALQTQAFSVIAQQGKNLTPEQRLQLIELLATASGYAGMVGGQAIDLALTNKPASYDQLVQMHQLKTGALISTAVVMGGICGGATGNQLEQLKSYGEAIGLAFQIRDDLLDEEGDTAHLGKQAGMDSAANKTTFPSIIGLDAAREEADLLKQKALDSLSDFSQRADALRELAAFIVERDR